jgi:hypothetical protein
MILRKDFSMQRAGEGLEKIVARSLRHTQPSDAPRLAWPLVCGSQVAERTRAFAFSGGVLRVEVADSGWKRELQELAPRYLAAINRYVGRGVQKIEFVVASAENGREVNTRLGQVHAPRNK